MKFSSPSLLGSALFLFACATAPASANPTFSAYVTVVTPVDGEVFYDIPYALPITANTDNQYVQITGGTPNGSLDVSWTMTLEFDDSTGLVAALSSDSAVDTIALFNGAGMWTRKAAGTGSLFGNSILPPGLYSCIGVSSLTSTGNAYDTSSTEFTVLGFS